MPDPAVAIVESYLRVNGYFTVTEHPIVEAAKRKAEEAERNRQMRRR